MRKGGFIRFSVVALEIHKRVQLVKGLIVTGPLSLLPDHLRSFVLNLTTTQHASKLDDEPTGPKPRHLETAMATRTRPQ
jgi:hypothetical protein